MAAPARRPQAPAAPARIGVCQAEFEVGAPNGPLSSPEKLLAAVRQEILPALSEVLDDPEMAALQIDAPLVEIELGAWPDDPIWSDVRYVLALKLRHALEAYGQIPKSSGSAAQRLVSADRKTTDAPQRPKAANEDIGTTPSTHPPSTPSSSNQTTRSSRAEKSPIEEDHSRATGTTAHPPERLEDPAPSQALTAFLVWLSGAEQMRDTAEILAHLAERPGLQNALQLWRVAASRDQHTALPLSETQRLAVLSAAERLTSERAEPTSAPEALTAQQQADDPVRGKASHSQPLPADPATPTRQTSQTSHAPKADQGALARLRQLLATGSTPEAERLRATAHWLAIVLQKSGADAEAAKDHAVRLIARLQSDPDLAKAFTSQPVPLSSTHSAERVDGVDDPQTDQLALTSRSEPLKPHDKTGSSAKDDRTRSREPLDNNEFYGSPSDSSKDATRDAFVMGDDPPTRPITEDTNRIDPALRALAATLTPKAESVPEDPGALRRLVLQAFTQLPAQVFQAAKALDQLPELSNALHSPEVAQAVLTGEDALSAPQISALHNAGPAVMPAVLAKMAVTEIRQLINHLLPENADLLREQIAGLQHQARHPTHALQRVVLALLEKQPLDVEDLRAAEPFAMEGPTQNPEAQVPSLNEASAPAEPLEETAPDQPTHNQRNMSLTPRVRDLDGQSSHVTPLRALLSLSGLVEHDIARVTAQYRPETQDESEPRSDGLSRSTPRLAPAARGSRPHQSERSDADLREHLARLVATTSPANGPALQEMLALIWSVWPQPPGASLPPSGSPTADFLLLRAQLTAQASPSDGSLAELLKAALPVLEPETERQVYAMRTALTRLSSLTGPDVTGLRASTRAALEYQLSPAPDEASQLRAEPSATLEATTSVFADNAPGEETFQVTESAGLVLLHPFFTLLFDRMKIEREGKVLAKDHLPRALGALQFLAGEAVPNDPLHRVLLGLDAAVPLPEAETPDEDACTLMDGLLRSVIDRWGRLGATSPDGLRQTFLRRSGTLRFDETGAHLRVTPGPFDMLLDSLPWNPSPVALPWMPLPCHVLWREDEDA